MANNFFHTYYDLLFEKKDYSRETELIFELSEKYGIKSPQKILEIGCGTGNHTKYLLEKNVDLVAIDTDPIMVDLAREKLKNHLRLNLQNIKVEDLAEKDFDLVLAMFNVITYIPTTNELESFMKGVSDRLKSGGVFIFDCWNGIAAIKDPPKTKESEITVNGEKIKVTITPATNFFEQKTKLSYQIADETYLLDQTLWTPLQVLEAAKKASLEIVLSSPLLEPDKQATDKDWKIMFVAKKN